MTDATGAITRDRVHRPFGETHVETGTAINNQRFPGQIADASTGLNYNDARHYYPSIGRYITSDPIGLEGGINTHAYVGGNPVKNIDPRGLDAWVGGEVVANGMALALGGSGGMGVITNARTGEICIFRQICGRFGIGILVSGGGRAIGSILGPECGKDIGGYAGGVGFDLVIPGGGGFGGAVTIGGGLGGAVNAGIEGGAGVSVGFDVCRIEVIQCTNTPPECNACSQ